MNSKGITIVELMIGIVLFSIVALSVTYFISTGTTTCQEAEHTINIQEESQVVMNQVMNVCMEANSIKIVKQSTNDVCLLVMNTDKNTHKTGRERILYFEKSSGKLYFYEVDSTTSASDLEQIEKEINQKTAAVTYGQLLGEYLKSFTPQFDLASKSVTIKVTIALCGKEMQTEDSIVLRNKYVETDQAFVEIN